MAECSLPNNFCACYSLKSGGKFIAGLCLGTSIISCIFLAIYLSSDPTAIAREIASDDEKVEPLSEDGKCK